MSGLLFSWTSFRVPLHSLYGAIFFNLRMSKFFLCELIAFDHQLGLNTYFLLFITHRSIIYLLSMFGIPVLLLKCLFSNLRLDSLTSCKNLVFVFLLLHDINAVPEILSWIWLQTYCLQQFQFSQSYCCCIWYHRAILFFKKNLFLVVKIFCNAVLRILSSQFWAYLPLLNRHFPQSECDSGSACS